VQRLVCLLFILIAVAFRLPPVSGLCEVLCWVASLCVRALNFVHNVRCVKMFTLSECVITETAVRCGRRWVLRLFDSFYHYDTIRSRQRSFVRFWWLCFNWSQNIALWCIGLLFSLCGGIAAGVQTVQWSELWLVNSLQSLVLRDRRQI